MSASTIAPAVAPTYDGFADFYARYSGRLCRYVARCAGAHDAEEIAQETMARALLRFHELDTDRDPFPWLVVVARNVAHDMRRAAADWVDIDDTAFVDRQSQEQLPEDVVVGDELMRRLSSALEALPPKQRDILGLRTFDELSCVAIGQVVGLNENAVRQTLLRARRRLGAEMDALGGRLAVFPLGLLAGARVVRRHLTGSSATAAPAVAAAGMVSTLLVVGVLLPATGAAQPSMEHQSVTSVDSSSGTAPGTEGAAMTGAVSTAEPVAPMVNEPVAAASSPADAAGLPVQHTLTASASDNPLGRGQTHDLAVSVVVDDITVGVRTEGVNGEGSRPVCSAVVLVDCETAQIAG